MDTEQKSWATPVMQEAFAAIFMTKIWESLSAIDHLRTTAIAHGLDGSAVCDEAKKAIYKLQDMAVEDCLKRQIATSDK